MPGNDTNLVVLKGDPSRDIADIEHVEPVFKDGIAYDPAKADRLGARHGRDSLIFPGRTHGLNEQRYTLERV
jgi:hypothetical protein